MGDDSAGRREAQNRDESVAALDASAERDIGKRPGLTADERARLKQLERRNVELKRADGMLKKTAAIGAPGVVEIR